MKKKFSTLLSIFFLLLFLLGLFAFAEKPQEKRYDNGFFGTFDTWVRILAYAPSVDKWEAAFEAAQKDFVHLHQLYDKYNEYEGINNIYILNKKAAIEPIKVEKELLDLLLFAKDMQNNFPNTTNIALGSVLEIWHQYREEGTNNPAKAALPTMELLEKANQHTDFSKVIINKKDSTVFFEDSKLQLDVGAVAKGYATQVVADNMPSYGISSFSISAGGNIVTGEPPKDGRKAWAVGIQDPTGFILDPEQIIDSVYVNHTSVVTSGDYQRYYEVDGKKYHHIIDPVTLFPANQVKQVAVVTPHSGVADFLSTVLYILPIEEALAVVENLENTEACWVTMEDEIVVSSGWKNISHSGGVTNTP